MTQDARLCHLLESPQEQVIVATMVDCHNLVESMQICMLSRSVKSLQYRQWEKLVFSKKAGLCSLLESPQVELIWVSINGGLTQVITDLDASASCSVSPMPSVGDTGDPSKGWALESPGVTPSGANCGSNDGLAQPSGVNADLYALPSCRISPMP